MGTCFILQVFGLDSIGCCVGTALMSEKVGYSLWLFIHYIGGSIWCGTGMPVTLEGVELPFLGRRPFISKCILPSSVLSQHWWQMTVLALCFSHTPVVKKILLTDCHLTSETAPCGCKRHSEQLLRAVHGFQQMSLRYLHVWEVLFISSRFECYLCNQEDQQIHVL